jgi:DNA-binding HxlR family transcriptional regulator
MDGCTTGPRWTDPNCPVARAADLVGDRWSMLIIRDAMDGARAFSEFQRRTGIARNILSDRLQKLLAAGLVRQVDAPVGKRKHYELTTGETHAYNQNEPHSILVDESGTVVPELIPVTTEGTPLTSRNTHVVHVQDMTA